MNIKERIGQRIKDERTAQGLTRKALAELTDTLKVSRINNYERGERTPGPEEIKQLARALEVSPAFLMCLSDDKSGKLKQPPGLGALVPILTHQQACNPTESIEQLKGDASNQKVNFVPVGPELASKLGDNAFALEIKDESMNPELRVGDILIISPNAKIQPGDFVAAKLESEDEVIIRKYKQLSSGKDTEEFELVALNSDWANLYIDTKKLHDVIIGCIISIFRNIKTGNYTYDKQ